jgi:Uma2 family endonuclease
VRLGEGEVPQPDIILWEPIRARGPVPADRVRLVVEVADTTQADDLGRKRALYAAAGIPEYWVVDLPGRVLHQYWAPELDVGVYARAAAVPFGVAARSATLEGLAVVTDALG